MTYNGIMEEAQIATSEAVQDQVPLNPQMRLEEMRQEALVNFKKVIANKPSRQQLKVFLTGQAMAYLGQTSLKTLTRKQRRIAARAVAARLTKKTIAGEDIFDAGV